MSEARAQRALKGLQAQLVLRVRQGRLDLQEIPEPQARRVLLVLPEQTAQLKGRLAQLVLSVSLALRASASPLCPVSISSLICLWPETTLAICGSCRRMATGTHGLAPRGQT